jgi:hypothetical protein
MQEGRTLPDRTGTLQPTNPAHAEIWTPHEKVQQICRRKRGRCVRRNLCQWLLLLPLPDAAAAEITKLPS